MATAATTLPAPSAWTKQQVGMLCFLCSEFAFFSTLIVAYVTYIGKSASGPTPAETLGLTLPVFGTVFLLSSSGTIVLAERALRRGSRAWFALWLLATIAMGAAFLVGTGLEWADLIGTHGLTLGRNLFGTTYFTLIGFHAGHVSMGLITMLVLLGLTGTGSVSPERTMSVELVSWYWHFVDGVWVAIFLIVYVFGR